MSNEDQNPGTETSEDTTLVQNELDTLKARANMMSVPFHPNISAAKLREKIALAMAGEPAPAEDKEVDERKTATAVTLDKANPALPATVKATEIQGTDEVIYAPAETAVQKRARLKRDASEMIRIRITCMNPAKKEWSGEIFTTGNSAVGTFKNFVPFNAEDGWHVPRMIYNMIRERQCQIFINSKTKNGVTVRQGKMIKEFAIEILDPLSQNELNELARRQALAAGKE